MSHYQQTFTLLASRYRIIDFISLGFTSQLRNLALTKIQIGGNKLIVDLMCGDGSNATFFKNDNCLVQYIGVDYNRAMLERARIKFGKYNRMTFLAGDVLESISSERNADAVLCSFGMKCFSNEDYPKFVRSVSSLLSGNGTFTFVEFQKPKNEILTLGVTLYLRIVYGLLCLFLWKSLLPFKQLMQCLSVPLPLDYIRELFEANGFIVNVETKWNGAAILIYGRKLI